MHVEWNLSGESLHRVAGGQSEERAKTWKTPLLMGVASGQGFVAKGGGRMPLSGGMETLEVRHGPTLNDESRRLGGSSSSLR